MKGGVLVVGEAWGAEEEIQKKAFVGPSGQLLRSFLAEQRIEPSFTNLVNMRPPGNEFDWFRRPENRGLLENGLRTLKALIEGMKPSLVIGMGNEPLRYLAGIDPPSITTWRGSQLWLKDFPSTPFLPTVHPAAVLRTYEWSFFLRRDLQRAARFLRGEISWEGPLFSFATNDLSFLKNIRYDVPLAVDIETHEGLPTLIGLSQSPTSAVSFTFPPKLEIWLELRRVLSTHPMVVGHNFLYDATYLRRFFAYEPTCWFDTMVGHHLLFPGLPKDLGFLASIWCSHFVQWKTKRYDPSAYVQYNCEDTCRTFEISRVLRQELEKEGLWPLYENERRETWKIAAEMTWRGLAFDEGKREILLERTQELLSKKEYLLRGIWGKEGWWRSSAQVKTLFYEILNLQPIVHRKTGRPTVSRQAFEALAKKSPHWLQPTTEFILRLLEEVRSLQVFISSFLEKTTDFDGRLRCFFDIAGTETFRLSSSRHPFGSGGNLQNIPTGTED